MTPEEREKKLRARHAMNVRRIERAGAHEVGITAEERARLLRMNDVALANELARLHGTPYAGPAPVLL